MPGSIDTVPRQALRQLTYTSRRRAEPTIFEVPMSV